MSKNSGVAAKKHGTCVLRMARVNCGSLAADFVPAGKSAARKARRERHFMSKRSCEAAESIEDALLRMKWRGELLEYYAWISRTRQYCFREKCFSTTPYTLNPNC